MKGRGRVSSASCHSPSMRMDFWPPVRQEAQADEAEARVRVSGLCPRHHLDRVVAEEQFLPRDAHELPGVRVADLLDVRVPPLDVLLELGVCGDVRCALLLRNLRGFDDQRRRFEGADHNSTSRAEYTIRITAASTPANAARLPPGPSSRSS